MNYGIERLSNLLPRDDYNLFSSSGDGSEGYSFGLGISWPFSKHFELVTFIDYTKLNYAVNNSVYNTGSSTLVRPIQPQTPIYIVGDVGYSFINIEPSIRYYFNPNKREGFFAGILFSNMIHLGTDWEFTVKYEDQRIEENVDFSENQEGIEFNNIFFLGVNTGYYFKVKENFHIGPVFDLRFGLNPIVEDGSNVLNPSIFGININSKISF